MKLLISDYYNTRDDKWIYEILAVVASFEAMCGGTLVRTYICIATDYSLEYPERDLAVVKYLSPSELTSGSFSEYNSKLFKHFNIDKE